jgi:multisubunit Na+/H+ antiporter MnhB subunit
VETTETIYGPNIFDYLGLGFSAFLAVSVIVIVFATVALWRSATDRERFARISRIQIMIGVGLWGLALAGAEWSNLQHWAMIVTLRDSGFDPHFFAYNEAAHAARSMLAHFLLALTAFLFVIANFARSRSKSTG